MHQDMFVRKMIGQKKQRRLLTMALSSSSSQPLPLTLPSISSSQSHSLPTFRCYHNSHSFLSNGAQFTKLSITHRRTSTILSSVVASVGNEDSDLRVSSTQQLNDDDDDVEEDDDDDEEEEPTPQDLEYIAQIKRVNLLLLFFFPNFLFIYQWILISYCRFWSCLKKTGTCYSGRYTLFSVFTFF